VAHAQGALVSQIDRPGRGRHNGGVSTARGLVAVVGVVAVLAAAFLLPRPARAAEYEVGPGDVLKVVVIGQADMTGNFTVDAEGMVNFPILGRIKASQNTPLEIERKLTVLLADGYLKRPQVTVTIAEYGSQKVFVTGEVQRPGQYALKADRSLLALLGDIGPLSADVGHEVIVVRPPSGEAVEVGGPPSLGVELPKETPAPEGGASPSPATAASPEGPEPTASPSPIPGLPYVAPGSEVFRVSLLELQSGNPEKNITLQTGDTVYFPKAAHVYVMGSVARPGPIRYEEGMTVLQALTLAGGVTSRGSAGRTKIVRIVNGKKVEHKTKPTDLVQPEDTLMVPERFF
jgi:polysaccharide export outer membrane protein